MRALPDRAMQSSHKSSTYVCMRYVPQLVTASTTLDAYLCSRYVALYLSTRVIYECFFSLLRASLPATRYQRHTLVHQVRYVTYVLRTYQYSRGVPSLSVRTTRIQSEQRKAPHSLPTFFRVKKQKTKQRNTKHRRLCTTLRTRTHILKYAQHRTDNLQIDDRFALNDLL